MSLTSATPRAPDLSGHALDGRYELLALIGEGSFGRVYRGYDRRLARPVAVKVIKPWWAEDPEWVRRFEREAQMMARVSDARIIQIFDVGYAEEGLYYVAELVDGESLDQRLRRGRLAPATACDIAAQLCRALAHAHSKRVVHGDIKPANILISVHGTVKVGDFGVARLAEGSSVGAGATIAGTPRYMAPEQARGRGTTAATDVYSVGVVLYEMLAGRPPFAGSSPVELALAHLQDEPAPLRGGTPVGLARVVDRALAKDPHKRYQTGAEMADALARARTAGHGRQRRAVAGWIARRARSSGSRAASAARDRGPAVAGAARTAATRHLGDAVAAGREHADRFAKTRVAPRLTPRRDVNPSGRRRRIALVGAVAALVLAMIAAAVVIGGIRHVRVPDLRGMTTHAIGRRVHKLGLHAVYRHAYSGHVRKGIAISQDPSARQTVRQGSTVRVTLSAGPRPVPVPSLDGMPASQARAALEKLHLRTVEAFVPAFGATPGDVTSESPGPGHKLLPGGTVTLSVAETPRWRPLTAFTGGASVPFKILGHRWRLVYRMGYDGNCTFIFICNGPTAHVTNLGSGAGAGSFDLNEGTGEIWTFQSGPGTYQVRVSPGSDGARWSMQVQDYY
jgi:eukaryotic-like serine/threonine-protein kinase